MQIENLMTQRLYRQDPLTPKEREEFETDLITFCDRELERLGGIEGLRVLYAGGASLLWLEGLSQKIGAAGNLIALEADEERLAAARASLREMELPSPVRLVRGDVFEPPFEPGSFDLVYSAGLLHELDVRGRSAGEALAALAGVVKPGGRVATSDFVDSAAAVQIEDEAIEREIVRATSGALLYGIGPPGRVVALHEDLLDGVRWEISPPLEIRHLEKVVLAEEDPTEKLPRAGGHGLRERRAALLAAIRCAGYSRPATLYVEGRVPLG